MIDSIYEKLELSKTGIELPVLKNGRTIESKYNPEREADNIISTLNNYNFFLVLGIGSGTFIKKLSEKFPNAKVICVERTKQDLHFISHLQNINLLQSNENIIFTDVQEVSQTILNNYLPAKFGDLKIIELKAWTNENQDIFNELKQNIEHAIRLLSADYSVQSHFGKIWQTNIINNLKILSTMKQQSFSIDNKKKAVVVAAGPTLDKTINILKKADYFIISTDTAFSSLIKNGINVDAVISIDGQNISHNHFLHKCNPNTLFFFDLCSNFSAVKSVYEKENNVIFFKSGHPLSALAEQFTNENFIQLFTGSGTVTIAALDFAYKLGFTDIQVLGADFSYSNGKAYTKGTYFDSIYNTETNKIQSSETNYDKLMYRTPLICNDNKKYSTEVLNAYKYSFEQYAKDNKMQISKSDDVYLIKCANDNRIIPQNPVFNFDNFIKNVSKLSETQIEIPLLPYIAWLRKNNQDEKYSDLLKLAYSTMLSYNI